MAWIYLEGHRGTEHQLPWRAALQGLVIPRERRAGDGGGAYVVAVEQVAHVQPQLQAGHGAVRTEAVGGIGVHLPEGRHADVVLIGEWLAQVGGAGGTKAPVTEVGGQVADQRDLRVARLGVALDRVHRVTHHKIAVVVGTGHGHALVELQVVGEVGSDAEVGADHVHLRHQPHGVDLRELGADGGRQQAVADVVVEHVAGDCQPVEAMRRAYGEVPVLLRAQRARHAIELFLVADGPCRRGVADVAALGHAVAVHGVGQVDEGIGRFGRAPEQRDMRQEVAFRAQRAVHRPVLGITQATTAGAEVHGLEADTQLQRVVQHDVVLQVELARAGHPARCVVGLERGTVHIERTGGLQRRALTQQWLLVPLGLGCGLALLLPETGGEGVRAGLELQVDHAAQPVEARRLHLFGEWRAVGRRYGRVGQRGLRMAVRVVQLHVAAQGRGDLEAMVDRGHAVAGDLAGVVRDQFGQLTAGVGAAGFVRILRRGHIPRPRIIGIEDVGLPAQLADHVEGDVVVAPDLGLALREEHSEIAPGHILLQLQVAAQKVLGAAPPGTCRRTRAAGRPALSGHARRADRSARIRL